MHRFAPIFCLLVGLQACSSTGDPRTANMSEVLFGDGKIKDTTGRIEGQAAETQSMASLERARADKAKADLEAGTVRAERLESEVSRLGGQLSEIDTVIEAKSKLHRVSRAELSSLVARRNELETDLTRLRNDGSRSVAEREARVATLNRELEELRALLEVL